MDQLGPSILGTKNSVSRPPKSLQRVASSLDFEFAWPQNRPHVGCEVGDAPSIWLIALDIGTRLLDIYIQADIEILQDEGIEGSIQST